MKIIKDNKNLPALLIDSKYRILRHLLLITTIAVITFNQVFIAYQDCQAVLGAHIYLICLPSFLLYLLAIYFNYFYLLPTFLLKDKYIAYLISLSILVFSLSVFSIAGEYWVRNYLALAHRITSYTNPLILIDSLASYILNIICFFGITIIQLFRNWTIDYEQINLLEHSRLEFELNELKGQLAPQFLFKTLNNSSALTKTNPTKANEMLMRLGQLLRYQLYDCNREKVLLSSDINNIENFLDLAKMNNSQLEYNLQKEGNLNNIFVSPLLFISFIQAVINESKSIKLLFSIKNKLLFFQCKSDSKENHINDEFNTIQERLLLLYPNNHRLIVENGVVELHIKLSK